MKFLFCAALLFLASFSALSAQILVLDFGPSTNPNTVDGQKTNLPYTTGISSSSTFNRITTANDDSSLVWSTGESASGVSLTFGAGNLTTVNFPPSGINNLALNFSALTGGPSSSGVYATGSAGQDGFFVTTNSGSSAQTSLGLSIGGLAAGTYQIFLSGKNTNSSGSPEPETFFSTAVNPDTDPTNLQNTAFLTGVVESNTTSGSFIEGDNYVVLTQTITAGETLNLYATGDATNAEERAFLNFAEIVPMSVPEPNSFVLMAAGLGVLVLMRRFRLSRNS